MRTNSKLLARYDNGNYTVKLYEDGTKIKFTHCDSFCADFPDSIDLKITNYCDLGCPMCHENSTPQGLSADLSNPFLSTIRSGTELAIGGGNPLSHPQLKDFLTTMQRQGVICNLTVNELHFLRSKKLLIDLLNERLIWGLGISLKLYDNETIEFARQNANVVLHAICGLLDEQSAAKLYDKDLKILLLGYKDCGRGAAYHSLAIDGNVSWLKDNVINFANKFNTVCFDNLAISQLVVQKQIPQQLFETTYMGDDGSASMYVDLVNRQYAVSSTSAKRYPLTKTIDEAFSSMFASK